jgi:hypothetical protein
MSNLQKYALPVFCSPSGEVGQHLAQGPVGHRFVHCKPWTKIEM